MDNSKQYTSNLHIVYDPRLRRKTSKMSDSKKENIMGTIMASGPFLGFILFSLIPMVVSLIISFTELRGFNVDQAKYVGFENYIKLLTDPNYTSYLKYAISNTLTWLINVPLNMLIALFIANLLSKKLKGSRFLRTILFIPSICSTVAVTLMWQWILDPNYGIINTILQGIGLNKIPFTSDPNYFLPSCLLISVWIYGTNIVLMQNALSSVNKEVKEAASMDGASDFYIFWKVTVPLITPTLFYLLITNLVTAFQEMQIMQLIASNGIGPGYKALTLSYYIYRMAYVSYGSDGLGIASALSWMMAIVIMVVSFINFKFSKKWVHYD